MQAVAPQGWGLVALRMRESRSSSPFTGALAGPGAPLRSVGTLRGTLSVLRHPCLSQAGS